MGSVTFFVVGKDLRQCEDQAKAFVCGALGDIAYEQPFYDRWHGPMRQYMHLSPFAQDAAGNVLSWRADVDFPL